MMRAITCKDIIKKRVQLWDKYKSIDKDLEFREAVAEKLIDEDSKNLRCEIINNPEYLIEMFFIIVDKDQNIVPFFLNNVQKLFLSRLNKDVEKYKNGEITHLKYLILKGRQQG